MFFRTRSPRSECCSLDSPVCMWPLDRPLPSWASTPLRAFSAHKAQFETSIWVQGIGFEARMRAETVIQKEENYKSVSLKVRAPFLKPWLFHNIAWPIGAGVDLNTGSRWVESLAVTPTKLGNPMSLTFSSQKIQMFREGRDKRYLSALRRGPHQGPFYVFTLSHWEMISVPAICV